MIAAEGVDVVENQLWSVGKFFAIISRLAFEKNFYE